MIDKTKYHTVCIYKVEAALSFFLYFLKEITVKEILQYTFAQMPLSVLVRTFGGLKTILAPLMFSSWPFSSATNRPSGHLTIIDSRTDRQYKIPIRRNAVDAIRFK